MISQPHVFQSVLDHYDQRFQHSNNPSKAYVQPTKSLLYYSDLSKKLRQYLIDITATIVSTLYQCDANLASNGPSLKEFIFKLIVRSKVPTNNILCALLYLVRLKQRHPECKGTNGAECRLFLAALIVSNKYLYDNAYQNISWMQISGRQFTLTEINFMEFELLYFLNFRVNVTKEQWLNFVDLIDLKVTESWRKSSNSAPSKFLYSKATVGIDVAKGKTSPLPFLMKSSRFREESYQSQCNQYSVDIPTSLSPFNSKDKSRDTFSSANSISSNDSGPKTPYR
ncbi:hypothetical protein K7432_005299 [Basidiobolus ranarum]|uniref:Cyclin n=1 Tax=Basidiobolus ranarum TaxID=34480 RepID=A0ABR2W3G8_9FUNG